MRIVSLLPSATDIVCSLGLRDQLVGRTHECDWPPEVASVPVMTSDALETSVMSSKEIDRAIGAAVHSGSSIYHLDLDALESAKPDLILTQELCEVCAVSYHEVAAAARVMEVGPTVVSLEPRGMDDILEHVLLVGRLVGAVDAAASVVSDARARLEALPRDGEPLPVVCVEWLDPVYACGHWVPEQVAYAGGRELLGRPGEPSRTISWQDVIDARPEVVVLMPCGVPIERAMREAVDLPRFPAVWCVDGSSYFNRPGPRVVSGAEILAALLHGGDVGPAEARRVV